jgi:hypothetical protein
VAFERSQIWGPRVISCTLRRGDYACSIDLWGGSKVGAFGVHWFTTNGETYPARFAGVIRGNVNPYHYTKATAYYDTPNDLVSYLHKGWEWLVRECST